MKKHIALFALSAAAIMGLSACAGTGNDDVKSSDEASISASETNPSEDESSESSEIDLSVALTIDAPAGVDVDIEDAPKDGKYYPGDEISFTVTESDSYPSNKVVTGVAVNGRALSADDAGNYYFVMSKNGATIKVNEKTIGDINIETVSDVDATKIPTLDKADYDDVDKITAFCESVGAILKAGDATHATYLRDCSVEILNSPFSGKELSETFGLSASIYQGKGMVYATGDKVKLEFSSITGATNNTSKYSIENGYADEDKTLYYKRNAEFAPQGSYYDYGGKTTKDEIYVYKVVNDDIADENFASKTMIKAKDAESHATSFGIGSVFASQVFGDGSSAGLTKTDYSSGKIVRQIKDVSTVVSEDGKSYTMKVAAYDLSYLDVNQFYGYETEFTVDGDGFVSKLSIHKLKYANKDYWDSENDTLSSDAVAESDSYSVFNLTRGYKYSKDVIATTDVSKYKMSNYDVTFNAQTSWSGTFNVSTADVKEGDVLTFEVGTQIKGIYYTDFSSDTAILLPTFKGTEEDGFITETTSYSTTTYTIDKEGETSFLFDNGFGDVKTVPVKFVNPAPYGIAATLSSSTVVLGESITLSASVTPAAAEQGMTVTLAEDDPTESTLTKGESVDGVETYTITPTKIGSSSVTITSTVDPSVTKTVAFAAAGPATLDGVKALLPTVTFASSDADKSATGYDIINMNFNDDGTGTVACVYNGRLEGSSDFTWTIDESTLEVTVVQTSAADNNTVLSLIPVNSATFTMKISRYSSEKTIGAYPCTRVSDLTKGPWVVGNA